MFCESIESMLILTKDQENRISYLTEDCSSLDEYKEKLKSVESPIELHQIAMRMNWDYDLKWFSPIIKHRLCDRGTAIELYWLGQPDYYVGYEDYRAVNSVNRESYQLLKYMETVYRERTYEFCEIEYNPLADFSLGVRRCLAKYSVIPDAFLMPSVGDLEANLKDLSALRNEPDDLEDTETLKFLASTYYPNAGKYTEALDYADKLVNFEPDNDIFRSVKKQIFSAIQKEISSGATVGIDTNKFQENHIKFLQEEVEILKALQANGALPAYRRTHREASTRQLAELLGEQERFKDAVIVLEELLQSDDLKERRKNSYKWILAKMYAGIPNEEKSLLTIDEFLQESEPYSSPYLHKYKILNTLGKDDEAEALLDDMIQHLSNAIELAAQDGSNQSAHLRQKARLLYEFRGDHEKAIELLKHIIEEKIYYDDQDKMYIVGSIKALENRLSPNEFLGIALGAIETKKFDHIENLRDDITPQHVADLMSTWNPDLPWEIKDGYIHLFLDQTGELTAPVMIDGLGSPVPENRASALVILSERELNYDDLLATEEVLTKAIEEWQSKTDR